MTIKDKQKLLELNTRELELLKARAKLRSKDKLIPFCKYTDRLFEVSDHHDKICEYLEKVESGEIKRLIITMPPRHGKSRLASQEFPAWYLGRNPAKHVMISSYSATLAESFSRKTRERVRSIEYSEIFKLNLKDDSQNVKHWETDKQGGFISAGVGGAITGKGFHLGIVDDPLSNREEAESQLIRDKVWDWFTSTFYTRQEKDAAMIVIQTRWHEDDLAGRIIENMNKGGEQWQVLHLKAISDEGQALWESKYNLDKLNEIRAAIGPRDFNSLYQGEPFDELGGAFKKEYFQFYHESDIRDKKLNVMTFVDPAISKKESADYSAIVTVGLDPESNNIYILDAWRDRVEPDGLIDNLFRIVYLYKPERVGVEVVQFQKMLALEIRKQMNIRNKFFVLDEVTPMGEKEARIRATLQARYANHSVLHNHKCGDLEEEFLKFPSGKHDDLIDAASGAVKMLSGSYSSEQEIDDSYDEYIDSLQ